MQLQRPSARLLSAVFTVAAALLCLLPGQAWAIEYEVFIDIEDEEELYDLYVSEQISEDTFNTLVELHRRGVDLNSATREELYTLPNLTYDDVDRILTYRTEVGIIHGPGDLVAAGVLDARKLGALLPYVRAHDKKPKLTATHGWVRYQTAWSVRDSTVPPMALQARLTTLRQLTVGVAGVLTRQRVGNPVWDPNRDALVADPMRPRVHLPKYFVQWDNERWGIIAGTYRVGFGQRLVFDTSSRHTPNGFYLDDAVYRPTQLGVQCRTSTGELPTSPCTGEAGDVYGTKDLRWRDSLRGVAIGAKHLSLPVGWLQMYGFGSWQSRQVYQYSIYEKDRCDDPRSTDDSCSAPDVLERDPDNPLAPSAAHKFQTLPNMYDEVVGGANVSWFYDRRTHVGITGYGASAYWKADGVDLDFQEWSSTPFGGAWGAVGADMSWGRDWSDLAIEVARSFDSMATVTGPDYGGGGLAGIVRHTTTLGKHELELSGRYYDEAYANPFAGSIAQADQFDGNRARDEAGGRVRYSGRVADRVDLRALGDFWVQPSRNIPKFYGYARADVDVNDWFRPGLWFLYRTSDLRPGSTAGCVDTGELDENQPNPDGSVDYRTGCLAEVGQITGRLTFRPLRQRKRLSITAQYQHEVIDDVSLDGRPRQDAAAYLIVRANPVGAFRLSARLRYLYEDIADNGRFEQSVWTYLEASYVVRKLVQIRLRYDLYAWLDDRDNTQSRRPSPEHRLRLQLEARF